MQNRSIAESLKPTFENVTREFITGTMYRILFSNEIPNFKFDFRQEQAINFIEKVLEEYANRYDFFKKRAPEILKSIQKKSNDNETQPIMIIKNYREFFELLRQYYEKHIELYFERTGNSGLPVYEQKNCFEEIWLRATPDDFSNSEKFLKKQVDMIKDKTFEKYDNETYLGKLERFDNHIICVKNEIARTWDETPREFKIIIYDKKQYRSSELFYRSHFTLPVIRYGIYERDGKKVCYIGSIQNKRFEEDKDTDTTMIENIKSVREELNEGRLKKENYKEKVEPTKILALSIFINFVNNEGITEIEAPGMYVLDYEYHCKRSAKLKEDFDKEWTDERKSSYRTSYERAEKYLALNYEKQDIISEIKTERFVNSVKRLLDYYPNGEIKSYPGEVDSFLHLRIPIINSKNDINGNILRDMYSLVEGKYKDRER